MLKPRADEDGNKSIRYTNMDVDIGGGRKRVERIRKDG